MEQGHSLDAFTQNTLPDFQQVLLGRKPQAHSFLDGFGIAVLSVATSGFEVFGGICFGHDFILVIPNSFAMQIHEFYNLYLRSSGTNPDYPKREIFSDGQFLQSCLGTNLPPVLLNL